MFIAVGSYPKIDFSWRCVGFEGLGDAWQKVQT